MVLADSSLHPVLHFGMSGMAHVRGQPSPVYRVPRSASPAEDWPPKYMKAAIVFEDPATGETSDWAFCDPRRLGRIKLVEADEGDVERHPPLSELGADPLLDMPQIEVLCTALARRNAPIKAVLLDQNGVRPSLPPSLSLSPRRQVTDACLCSCSLYAVSAVRPLLPRRRATR